MFFCKMRLISLLIFSFVLCHMWIICIFAQSNVSDGVALKSTLRPIVERVFSRKKRWLLFPKGSSCKFTLNVSKRLLAMYPKGFNFVFEAAVYYPMISARIDLIPRRFRKPTTAKPPTKPTPLNLIGIPGSLIKYRAKPATKPPKVQRIDQNVTALEWINEPSLSPALTWPSMYYNNSQKWSKYSSPAHLKNYQWSAQKQQKYVNKYSNYNNNYNQNNKKWNRWSSSMKNLQQNHNYNYNNNNWNSRIRYGRDTENLDSIPFINDYTDMEYEPIYFEDLEPFEESPHYHAYRGRRELFHHFEGLSKILGIDMKSCILRAVCDSKRFLLPPGYSMIQDILRVIFTFPTINGLQDDYSLIMASDYQTCDEQIHHKCPFSILDWVLNSKNSQGN